MPSPTTRFTPTVSDAWGAIEQHVYAFPNGYRVFVSKAGRAGVWELRVQNRHGETEPTSGRMADDGVDAALAEIARR